MRIQYTDDFSDIREREWAGSRRQKVYGPKIDSAPGLDHWTFNLALGSRDLGLSTDNSLNGSYVEQAMLRTSNAI